jgi:protoporphyrinogen IX oxidase
MSYFFWKWLHIIAIISWMCGVLYLYRLLIYVKEKGPSDAGVHQVLGLMAHRLYKFITVPAMIVAAVAGAMMIVLNPGFLQQSWLQLKLLMVLGLVGLTLWSGHLKEIGRQDANTLPRSKTLRILNEVPTLLMMIIVWLVVTKSIG